MKFSLVVCTIGRKEPLVKLFESLKNQTLKDFEVILVDQNEPDFLDEIVQEFQNSFELKHLFSEKGLSRARNKGLENAVGEIFAFPDDDCWYERDLLERIWMFFEREGDVDGVTSHTIGEDGKQSVQRFDLTDSKLTIYNVWEKANSTTIFVRSGGFDSFMFDEKLGVGSGTKWGAGEDIDFLIRLIRNGANLRFDIKFYVYHPHVEAYVDPDKLLSRNKAYSLGAGYVIGKNGYPLFYPFYLSFRSLVGSVLSYLMRDRLKCSIRYIRSKSILEGWKDARKLK
ncbi:MAG: glycosyltransferase family 2 protein [Cyclobacteriaceae bacterium]|nr:glycosyltransferase family 2 protein [Cyclobacteriaceae bacterium HetDA_MAG_MS6]